MVYTHIHIYMPHTQMPHMNTLQQSAEINLFWKGKLVFKMVDADVKVDKPMQPSKAYRQLRKKYLKHVGRY